MNDHFKKAMDLSVQEGIDPITAEISGIAVGNQQFSLPPKSAITNDEKQVESERKAEALKPLIP